MKEINIAGTLIAKRKEKGITQEELSKYIGVSKASVSKWETGQSYPDITFLPQLAAYYNISIDDLMGYEPQMTKEDIRNTYHRLSNNFMTKPFDEVLDECRKIIKKYYACFPLLLQMGVLLLFHSDLAKNPNKRKALIMEAKELSVRVKNESSDVETVRKAQYIEATCYIALGDSQSALELLVALNKPLLDVETLLATAYHMEGKVDKAIATLQSGIYQYIISLFSLFNLYLILSTNEPKRYEETLHRALVLAETFDVKHLFPTVLIELYMVTAQGYIVQGNSEESLNMLHKFTELVTSNSYHLKPHCDDFFDLISDWLANLDLGAGLIKNEYLHKQSVVELVINNPAFSVLSKDHRFQIIIEKLTQLKERYNEKSI